MIRNVEYGGLQRGPSDPEAKERTKSKIRNSMEQGLGCRV